MRDGFAVLNTAAAHVVHARRGPGRRLRERPRGVRQQSHARGADRLFRAKRGSPPSLAPVSGERRDVSTPGPHPMSVVLPGTTVTGSARLSTPEAPALDLLRSVAAAGSRSTVATGLHDLAEACDAGQLVEAAQTGELPHAQRLGDLLDLGRPEPAHRPAGALAR